MIFNFCLTKMRLLAKTHRIISLLTDSSQLLGTFIASELDKFPSLRRMVIQNEIQTMLLRHMQELEAENMAISIV